VDVSKQAFKQTVRPFSGVEVEVGGVEVGGVEVVVGFSR